MDRHTRFWHGPNLNEGNRGNMHVLVNIPSYIDRTINSWNQLPAGLLASFHCKLNTFRKRVKNVVTGKGTEVGIECK